VRKFADTSRAARNREVREYDPQMHSRAVGLGIYEPPRVDWSLLVGDYLFNLRSALDHLAWQLVLANNAQPGQGTEFPIFKDPAAYKKRVARKTAGMQPLVVAVIESLQPYQPWESGAFDHPLWRLHNLCNIDKHRTLLLTSTWLPETVEFHMRVPIPGHTDEPAQVFFFETTRRPPEGEVDVYAQAALQVTLAEPRYLRRRPIVSLLRESLEFVRGVVFSRLNPFVR
jgi:hypothetical protein